MRKLTLKDKEKIRSLSISAYDTWVQPPPIDSLEKFFKLKPRNYNTVNLEQVSTFIIKNLLNYEPLLNGVSTKNLKKLETSIRVTYGRINFMDENSGGTGMIQPTFIELLSSYIFQIRENECADLLNESDKQFYAKYFWCFEQHCLLMSEQFKTVS